VAYLKFGVSGYESGVSALLTFHVETTNAVGGSSSTARTWARRPRATWSATA